MTPLPILTIGDPRLEQVAAHVPEGDREVQHQLDALHATLDDFRRRRGFGRAMAAPQTGIGKRVIVMNLGAGPISILNPEITWRSEEEFEVWDDCLSIPDRIVRVRRNRSISLSYEDEQRRIRSWTHLPPDLSELLQHEVDHLDGILMTQRAIGRDAVRPIGDHTTLVGAARPKHRLSLARIARAAETIDPVFRNTPQFDLDLLDCRVRVKVETVNPIRCFKGRGADFFLNERGADRPLICASAGNWGQALAYAARKRGRNVIVYAAVNANPLKVDRMRELGAEVRLEGHDFDAAKAAARAAGGWFVEDGLEAEITEGAGSIAVEMLSDRPALDAVLLPLGNGALLNGNARWMKAASPATRAIGVCAAGADSMQRSFVEGRPVERDSVRTIADGIAVRVPVPEAVDDMQGLVDEVRLVTDEQMLEAMRLLYRHTGLLIEPSGAAGVAALLASRGEFAGRHAATVLCGGNLTEERVRQWILRST